MRLWSGLIVVLLAWAIPASAARDMCKLLKDKGVLTELEYNECKAAQEKEEAGSDSKAREVLALKLPKWLDYLTPFGDLRVRHEGFYGDGFHARNRFRMRARLGMSVIPSDEISGTIRIASGNPDDPISSNQSFERTFTRKPFNLDQAFFTLRPAKTFGLEPGWGSITAGKFAANAYRTTEMVFDDDLNPEGASQTVNLIDRKEGMLRAVRLNAFQWVVDEIATDSDPWMGGGQIVSETAFGSAATWTASFADYHYEGLNGVARKFLSPTTPNASDPTKNSANSNRNTQLANSNRVVRDSLGDILRFQSRFNILHAATELNFANPLRVGVPGGVFGELVHNTEADGKNLGFAVGAGFGRAAKDWYHNTPKAVGDWSTSYTFEWVEKDAVPSMFSYSDLDYAVRDATSGRTQKGGTNVIAHILRFDYLLLSNFQLTAKVHFINPLDRSEATSIGGAPIDRALGNATLVRTQLDAILKF